MTETQTRATVRYLGGETGHRSFFGGTHSKARIALLAVFILAGLILTPIIGWPGLAIAAAGAGVTLMVTARTHRGTVMERSTRRSRWKERVTTGVDAFVPYDIASWDQAEQALRDAHMLRGRAKKDAIWEAQRVLTAMRANPDGADGMGWLQHGRREPGIAWHAPTGETQYLSATFVVTGQLRGIESTSVMTRAAEGWGTFLASRAAASNLVGQVQTMTRVLPADTAMQEFWVAGSLDEDVPVEAVTSYEEVLRLTGEDAMVQRHFITISWPITGAFRDTAAKYGHARDGWRGLMVQEIASTQRGLEDARLGTVEILTARQTVAVVLHQQNPSRPIDFVADVDPARAGIASHDEFSAHVVQGIDPITGGEVEWWHRTAAIRADAMATAPRTQLWLLDLLIGRDLGFIRSVSFHIHLIPAADAKAAARQDLVRDQAEAISRSEAGKFDTDDTEVAMTAAQRRRTDLTAGSHHHGAEWIGYITISTTSRDELARSSRQLEETCAGSAGIDHLDWQDSFQSAASGTTWPIGRGLTTGGRTLSSRLLTRLAGRTEKESLS
ncbi:MAG: hypothetical protein KF761_14440 [Salinibacterium sp.]|nr:hypothetical protein [Salinibacterium sp.]